MTRSVRRGRGKGNRLMLLLLTAMTVVCLFGYIDRMADIAACAKQIDALRSDIRTLKAECQQLEFYLAAEQSLERVWDEATMRLGMVYPGEGQVRIVSLEGYASEDPALMSAYARLKEEQAAP